VFLEAWPISTVSLLLGTEGHDICRHSHTISMEESRYAYLCRKAERAGTVQPGEEILSVSINTLRDGAKRTEPGSFH